MKTKKTSKPTATPSSSKVHHIEREKLLSQLESCQPGLSPKEIIEQSSSFVFRDGEVFTFSDEIACRRKCDLKITGAVQAIPLLAILRKLIEPTVDISVGEGELLVKGRNKLAGIVMDKNILLPIDTVEKPKTWKPLHEDFSDAIYVVEQCAGKDETNFWVTCVHLHQKWIEACDNFQMTRYKIKTGLLEPALVRRDSIKHIVSMDMREFSETEKWLHFKNGEGLRMSFRRYADEYPDMTGFINTDGDEISLPKGLAEAAEKAEIFSSENQDENLVLIDIRSDRLRVKGQGISGRYQEVKKLKYSGANLSFMIAPALLVEIVKRHQSCFITEEKLRVDGGKFVYLSCLTKTNGNENHKQETNND